MDHDRSAGRPTPASGAREPSALFREFACAALERETEPELAPYLALAGERRDELRRRVELLRALEELGREGREAAREEGAPPSTLGRYRVRGVLGSGGHSRVYLAEDPRLARQVALKVLSAERFSRREARAWIQDEGRALARLAHHGVVRVLDLGLDGDRPFLVMELVVGPSLDELLRALRSARHGGRSSLRSAPAARLVSELGSLEARCRIALSIARALAACHAAQVLHRDLKPSNVLLEHGREPRLVDFGIGRVSTRANPPPRQGRDLVGTPAYLSPEAVERGCSSAGEASDQFALGALVYELLTLVSPFARATRAETLAAVRAAAPAPLRRLAPEVPRRLERLVLRALAREPSRRHPSVKAFAEDLEAFLEHAGWRAGRRGLLRGLLRLASRARRGDERLA